jgi:hypothetical protein
MKSLTERPAALKPAMVMSGATRIRPLYAIQEGASAYRLKGAMS